MDSNSQKSITSNDTHLTVAIADLIISEVHFLNFSNKPRFKKVLKLGRNISKADIIPNRNLITKEIIGVVMNIIRQVI